MIVGVFENRQLLWGTITKILVSHQGILNIMKLDKKQIQTNNWLIIGACLSFQSSAMKAEGPYTSAFKLFTCASGLGCGIVGFVKMAKDNQSKDPNKK
jgi:hypothetical protein